jgi:hypothetical protein
MEGSHQAHASRSRGKKAAGSAKSTAIAGMRETEEARALLEKQLHSLYWWVLNACRIKGFLRAKRLDELETEGENLGREDEDFGDAMASAKDQPREVP